MAIADTIIWSKPITISASASVTVTFGRPYTMCSFMTLSGTGSGAVKLFIKGKSGKNYVPTSPNRIALAAGTAGQKVSDVVLESIKLQSSGTAATAVILVNAWNVMG